MYTVYKKYAGVEKEMHTMGYMASPLYAGKKKLLLVVAATLIFQFSTATDGAGNSSLAKNGCQDKCGNVSIPYPFGIGKAGCFLEGFEVNCTSDDVPVLNSTGTRLLEINLTSGEARIENNNISVVCDISQEKTSDGTFLPIGRSFMVSRTKNIFRAVGCSTIALISGDIQTPIMEDGKVLGDGPYFYSVSVCGVLCLDDSSSNIMDCSGRGCCQSEIPTNLRSFFPSFYSNHYVIGGQSFTNCSYAFVAELDWFQFDPNYVKPHVFEKEKLSGQRPPLVLDWVVDNTTCDAATKMGSSLCADINSVCINVTSGHRCICPTGYEGNPYLIGGCQDVNECHYPSLYPCMNNGTCTNTIGGYNCSCPEGTQSDDPKKMPCTPISKKQPPMKMFIGLIIGIGVGSVAGFMILVVIAIFITQRFKHRRAMKLKQKYFKQNRGQLLQQLVSQRTDIAERMIITVDELAKATNNFDPARELGGGGHGTVYKGILSDLHVVAIKKSKITVQREIDEFINEVAILSQINHRNVVKILGCCLETEVPLLVYEFISNGTLYHHLHVGSPGSLSWRNRLRIASEIASAIAYLHSSLSIPIIHRDIKSSNILLDDTLTSKVSDFGASRYIPLDRTGLTTVVQGTIGYLDPVYFYEGRLTDKSDVYSFGVIIVELLTRKKPFSYFSSNGEGLIAHFSKLHGEGNLIEILDPQVIDEGGQEVQAVAALASSCIRLRTEERPTMRQVNRALEGLLSPENHAGAHNMLAEEFDENGQTMMGYPSPDEGQSMGESTRWYSLEQESLMAVDSRKTIS